MFVLLIAESVFDLINVSLLVQGIETLMANVLAKNKQQIRDVDRRGFMARLSEAEVLHKRNQLVVQGCSMVH